MKGKAGVVFAALALVGVMALAVFPATAWRDQRQNRKELSAQVAVLTAENRVLEDRTAELRSDEEIERLARQYNLVKPGEEAYFIPPRPDLPAPATTPPPPGPEPEQRRSRSLLDRLASIF